MYSEVTPYINVTLFGDIKGPLDQPTHLKEIFSQIDDTGCREHSQTQAKPKEEPILTKTQSNILVIACTFLSTLVGVWLVFLAVRHIKLKALVAGLALVTAAPVTEARNSHAATKEPLIMPDKVICTEPITGFATTASIAALFIFVYMQCHGLSWLYGYKYTNVQCVLWDTLNIDWNDLKLYMSNQSVPVNVWPVSTFYVFSMYLLCRTPCHNSHRKTAWTNSQLPAEQYSLAANSQVPAEQYSLAADSQVHAEQYSFVARSAA